MHTELEAWLKLSWDQLNLEEIVVRYSTTDGVAQLLEVLQHTSSPQRWRLAYALDKINSNNHRLLSSFLDLLAKLMLIEQNSSVLRHYTHIFMDHSEFYTENSMILDFCFVQLQRSESAIAVKANCISLLYGFCNQYPEIQSEIALCFDQLLQTQSITPAIRSRLHKFRYI